MNILMYPIAEDSTIILIKEPLGKICFITAIFEALLLKVRGFAFVRAIEAQKLMLLLIFNRKTTAQILHFSPHYAKVLL